MATATELRDRIKSRLSRRTGTTYDAEILDALDHAQREVLEKSPTLPSYLRTSETLNITGAHSSLSNTDLASNTALRMQELPYGLAYADTDITTGFNGVRVSRFDDLDLLDQRHPGEATKPVAYFASGFPGPFTIELRPYVTGDLDYYIYYYFQDPTLPSAGDSLWCLYDGDLLMHTAGLDIAQFLRDELAINYFSQKRQEAHLRFIRRVEAELSADQEYVMGD